MIGKSGYIQRAKKDLDQESLVWCTDYTDQCQIGRWAEEGTAAYSAASLLSEETSVMVTDQSESKKM